MFAVLGFILLGLFVCWLAFCVGDARAGDEDRWWHNKDHKWW